MDRRWRTLLPLIGRERAQRACAARRQRPRTTSGRHGFGYGTIGCELRSAVAAVRRRPSLRVVRSPGAVIRSDLQRATLQLYNTLTRDKERSRRSIRATCACMSAARRSTTTPISAMRGRSSCSTCCSACCAALCADTSPMSATSPTSTTRSSTRAAENGEPIDDAHRRAPPRPIHADMAALGALDADASSRAPPSTSPEMIAMIEQLIANGPRLCGRRPCAVQRAERCPTTAGCRGRSRDEHDRRRARRSGALQARPGRLRAVEAIDAPSSRAGPAPGAGAGRAGTSSARR